MKFTFMSSSSDKPTVDTLRKMYEEQGADAVTEVRELLDDHATIKGILEDNELAWGESDAEITGTGGFFDKLEEAPAK